MRIFDLNDRPEFISGDGARLRELLHPEKSSLPIGYSLAHALVEPGATTRPHRLRTSEVYYILEGRGRMHIDVEEAEVRPGQAVFIPPGSIQFIENPGPADLVFLCLVDPAWRSEDEEILG